MWVKNKIYSIADVTWNTVVCKMPVLAIFRFAGIHLALDMPLCHFFLWRKSGSNVP